MRQNFIKRLRRMGLIRLHWLTEWQPRSRASGGPAPHLHAVAFFDVEALRCTYERHKRTPAETFVRHWLDVASECTPESYGQHVVPVSDIQGWFGYLAKHGARGVFHYQRQSDTLPHGWQKTGRMWGKSGEWIVSSDEIRISRPAFYALRRAVDRWLIAQAKIDLARAAGPSRVQAARKRLDYLRDPQKRLRSNLADHTPAERLRLLRSIGEVSGVSEWCDPALILRWLHACCYPSEVMDSDTGEILIKWYLKPSLS